MVVLNQWSSTGKASVVDLQKQTQTFEYKIVTVSLVMGEIPKEIQCSTLETGIRNWKKKGIQFQQRLWLQPD